MQSVNKKYAFFCLLILVLSLITSLTGTQAALSASAAFPEPQGKAALLMDLNSGRILYDKNSHQRMPPASVTKIMTALLTVENGNLDQVVEVSENAAATPECSIYLQPGETLTRRELLYACMLPSANDAAVALAESVSSDVEDFVDLMNQRADELGMEDTHFCNPHGLQAEEHYTSAYDLALLSRTALQDPIFREVVSTQNIIITGPPDSEEQRSLWNQNRLLYRYTGALGIKTGYTREAGNCVVGAAQKDNMILIAVCLNSPSVYDDIIQMLDYGFTNYQMTELPTSEDPLLVKVTGGQAKTVIVRPSGDILVAAAPEERSQLRCSILPYSEVSAPVEKGDLLGVCKIYKQNEEIGSVDLVAADSVELKPYWTGSFVDGASSLFKWFFFIILVYITCKNKRAQAILKSGLRYIVLRIIKKRSPRSRSVRIRNYR